MAQLHSFLPPPSPRGPFSPLPVDWASLSSPGSDSGLSSPPTSSGALTSSDDYDDYLAQLTLQMANHMLRDQTDHNPVSLPAAAIAFRDMPRWTDLFTDSPLSSLHPSPGSSYCGKKASAPADKSPPPEGYPGWDARLAYEPGIVENPIATEPSHDQNRDLAPGLRSNHTLPREEKSSDVRPERAQRQGNSGKRKPQGKNNHWKTRRGECYVGLSLRHQQGGGSEMRAVSLGDAKTRNGGGGSTGTGVFLPKTGGQTEQGRKQPRGGGCSTVLIPARVAHALMLHFSKMSHPQPQPQPHSSPPVVVGVPLHHNDSSGRGGWDPSFQQKSQIEPEEPASIDCNEMGLPQEWMY